MERREGVEGNEGGAEKTGVDLVGETWREGVERERVGSAGDPQGCRLIDDMIRIQAPPPLCPTALHPLFHSFFRYFPRQRLVFNHYPLLSSPIAAALHTVMRF